MCSVCSPQDPQHQSGSAECHQLLGSWTQHPVYTTSSCTHCCHTRPLSLLYTELRHTHTLNKRQTAVNSYQYLAIIFLVNVLITEHMAWPKDSQLSLATLHHTNNTLVSPLVKQGKCVRHLHMKNPRVQPECDIFNGGSSYLCTFLKTFHDRWCGVPKIRTIFVLFPALSQNKNHNAHVTAFHISPFRPVVGLLMSKEIQTAALGTCVICLQRSLYDTNNKCIATNQWSN